ncbi:MAG: hypothetical protein JST68_02975, partial [Bacteroidetes bacterium]|nr:hypothetical protein [Bacteroidota bacterium]
MIYKTKLIDFMTDKDYNRLLEMAKRHLEEARHHTKEQALEALMRAGILDENGNHTPPYAHLGAAVE